ncbi:hypothetical protein TNCT_372701 [Trichonephila clavata]|uniref:Uncharacterized protein n=1 Tax=Trichonephila clavata TaxID=2740835 RepID=A0A8X6JC25_TRICU|nr:hypothetical protein TNCT_372701 [Trichonephila clavata]
MIRKRIKIDRILFTSDYIPLLNSTRCCLPCVFHVFCKHQPFETLLKMAKEITKVTNKSEEDSDSSVYSDLEDSDSEDCENEIDEENVPSEKDKLENKEGEYEEIKSSTLMEMNVKKIKFSRKLMNMNMIHQMKK